MSFLERRHRCSLLPRLEPDQQPHVAITLPERGCITLEYGIPSCYPAVEPPQVIDTTGASDVFNSSLVAGIMTGLLRQSAIQMGLLSAALAIEKPGGYLAIPAFDELRLAS